MTSDLAPQQLQSHRLLQAGVLLFLLGLLVGLAIPALANPRMGLSSHLEGVMNGTFLVVLGLVWPRLTLSPVPRRIAFGLALYGTFVNFGTTLLAAALGAGEPLMPLAAAGYVGTAAQEALIATGLVSLSIAMITVCGIVLWGLRRPSVGSEATR